MDENYGAESAELMAKYEIELREQIQEAITVANGMPEEIRCGVLVAEYPDHVDITVTPEVPYGQVHRMQYLG